MVLLFRVKFEQLDTAGVYAIFFVNLEFNRCERPLIAGRDVEAYEEHEK
jgi:hypothetical protein